MSKNKQYMVIWKIDIEAQNPIDAARQARKIHLDPGSEAVCFEVTSPAGVMMHVDLQIEGEEENEIEGEWLEDSKSGRFKRVTTTHEASTWVCKECGKADVDPYESGCDSCGAEPESY